MVRHVADGLGRALDFDAVLRGESESNPESLRAEVTDLVRSTLASIGVQMNPPIQLDVNQIGDIRLLGDHPRAAEIELELMSDVKLQASIKRLTSSGATKLTIGPA